MKISARQYALGLVEALRDVKDDEIKNKIDNFIKILVTNNDIKKADGIIKVFSKLWNEDRGTVEAEVISASKLEEADLEELKKYITKEEGAKEAVIKESIDKSILGGVKIRYNDTVLDASLKNQIERLQQKLKS